MKKVIFDNQKAKDISVVAARVRVSCSLIAKEIGAVAYRANCASSWVRFLMPDNKVVFGSIAGSGDVECSVSDYSVFKGEEKIGFTEEKGRWRVFFSIPEIETDHSGYAFLQS